MYPNVQNRAWEREGSRTPHCILLRCKACGQRYWSQKNLGYIGARSIFHFSGGCQWMEEQFDDKPSCSCPSDQLEIDEQLMVHIIDCEECEAYGW